MTDEKTYNPEEFAGVSADPADWEEPRQEFPGEVIVSRYRWASEEYRRAFNIKAPPEVQIPQWECQVKNLSAQYADGNPVISYWTPDVKQWDEREKRLTGFSSASKNFTTNEKWKKVFGAIHPPENLIGKKAMFAFYSSMSMGRGRVATRVLFPISPLDDDYTFTGELRIIEPRAREDGGDGAVATPGTPSSAITHEEALEKVITEYLPGKAVGETPIQLVQKLPAELRISSVMKELSTPSFVTDLLKEGKLVDANGVLTLP